MKQLFKSKYWWLPLIPFVSIPFVLYLGLVKKDYCGLANRRTNLNVVVYAIQTMGIIIGMSLIMSGTIPTLQHLKDSFATYMFIFACINAGSLVADILVTRFLVLPTLAWEEKVLKAIADIPLKQYSALIQTFSSGDFPIYNIALGSLKPDWWYSNKSGHIQRKVLSCSKFVSHIQLALYHYDKHLSVFPESDVAPSFEERKREIIINGI